MNTLDKLIAKFEKFPGVGARQARRFAFHVMTLPETEVRELSDLIMNIKGTVIECESCRRFFAVSGSSTRCDICTDSNRDSSRLLVVERDVDIQPIERSGTYDGLYFVLGGTIPLLNNTADNQLRGNGLKKIITERLASGLSEIILAFSVNPDGENTARFVQALLAQIPDIKSVTVTELGRGLSTGSELEYADPETIKNALKNRH